MTIASDGREQEQRRRNPAVEARTTITKAYPFSLEEFAAALRIPEGEVIERVELEYPDNYDRPGVQVITQVLGAAARTVEATPRCQAELRRL